MTQTNINGSMENAANLASEPDKGAKATVWALIIGALAMTSCCILPLALVSMGISGIFIGKLSSLYQYHWYFLAFATAALAYGFYKAYRPINAETCPDGTCATPASRAILRTVVWGALVIVIGAVAFQYLAPTLFSPF